MSLYHLTFIESLSSLFDSNILHGAWSLFDVILFTINQYILAHIVSILDSLLSRVGAARRYVGTSIHTLASIDVQYLCTSLHVVIPLTEVTTHRYQVCATKMFANCAKLQSCTSSSRILRY